MATHTGTSRVFEVIPMATFSKLQALFPSKEIHSLKRKV